MHHNNYNYQKGDITIKRHAFKKMDKLNHENTHFEAHKSV